MNTRPYKANLLMIKIPYPNKILPLYGEFPCLLADYIKN